MGIMNIKAIISEIDAEIANLTKVKEALQGTRVKRGPGRPPSLATASPVAKKKAKRKMSAEGKARISAAQKARWAKLKTKK
jgi:hypothetical protein